MGAKGPHATEGRKGERSETVVPEATDQADEMPTSKHTIPPGTRQTMKPGTEQTKMLDIR